MVSSKPIGIDLFAGAGGLSLGLSQAGFDMKIGIEMDKYSAETLQKNHKDMKVEPKDITTITKKEQIIQILDSADVKINEIDLIAGGPPCQGFSNSNRNTRSITNPKNELYKDYFRFVKFIQPETFLFENVAGLRTLNDGAVLRSIIKLGKLYKYKIQERTVNACSYGVPQNRSRIFIIGTKEKADDFFEIDSPTSVSTKQAINDLPKLENGNTVDEMPFSKYTGLSNYQLIMRENNGSNSHNNLVTMNSPLILKRYEHIGQGENWSKIPKKMMHNYSNLNNCHSGIYYRLKWNEPSIVISNYRKNMLIHPEENRGLSVREAARLQSFPDDYKFYGPLGYQQQQVANAVPPLLAKKIGIHIVKYG
jgi:DNA (cytosine-5)-methyltransferase 1